MITKFAAPKLSANAEEATVTAWFASEGDPLKKGAPLLELTTDKTAFEVEAPRSGVLRRIVAETKSIVPVGYIVALIGKADDDLPDVHAENEKIMAAHREASAGAAPRRKTARRSRGRRKAVRATPAARRLARDLSVDLAEVQAHASAEVVNEEMVQAYADSR